MFLSEQLKALRARKQELLQESDVRRQLLTREWMQIEQRFHWLDQSVLLGRRALPYLAFAIPLINLWRKRLASNGGSLVTRIANALPVAQRVVTLWRSFQTGRP